MINSVPNLQYFTNARQGSITFARRNQNETPLQRIKDNAVIVTNGLAGLLGVNLILWGVQRFVNEKILIGKINNHFTKRINNDRLLAELAVEMRQKEGLDKSVKLNLGAKGEAYFNHSSNKVVLGPDKMSAAFHELGHAVIENKTNFLRKLQRSRGHYTAYSLLLYGLLANTVRPNYYQGFDETFGQKVRRKILNLGVAIPLIAFSPELITEYKASKTGLKFLKEKLKEGKINKSMFKNIKGSYIACFGTYLFIPVSIMLLDALRNSANKIQQKRRMNYYNQFV